VIEETGYILKYSIIINAVLISVPVPQRAPGMLEDLRYTRQRKATNGD